MNYGKLLVLWGERLQFHCFYLGWPALLGVALAAAAITLDLTASRELHIRIDELRQLRLALKKEQASTSRAALPEVVPAQLAEREIIDSVIAAIHSSARKNGVRLQYGEYRLQEEPSGQLGRYQIVIPAQAGYLELRAWLDDVLAAYPGLSIQEFSMRRENTSTEILEARISLGLQVRIK